MVGIIVYGLIAGVILMIIPGAEAIGKLILSIVGILFVVTAAVLLLGQFLVFLLPYIILGLIIFGIYSIIKKIKNKSDNKYKSYPIDKKIDYLKRNKLIANNSKYKTLLDEIENDSSTYKQLISLLRIDNEIFSNYSESEFLKNTIYNLEGNLKTIVDEYSQVLKFSDYAINIDEEKLKDNNFCNSHVSELERYVSLQEEIIQKIVSFNKLVESTKKEIIEHISNRGVNHTKLFAYGEYMVRAGYNNINEAFNVVYDSSLKGYKLLKSQVNTNSEFNKTINVIEKIMNLITDMNIIENNNVIQKIKGIIYLCYVSNYMHEDIEKIRYSIVENLCNEFKSGRVDYSINFEEFELNVIGQGTYFKKRYEQWTDTGNGRIYRFRVQYKDFIIFIRDGVIENIKKGYMEE